MDNFDPVSQQHSQAQADLQHAEAQAAALLAELQAKDAANATAASVHKMPSPYAPGAEPDPVKGVAPSAHEQVMSALESSFKPVDLSKMKETTLASSRTVDFAQKIRDAQKFGGSH